ncbi:T6SS immunity protein Tdi1 domain-containing protein [Isoptericola variabilis]|uniref:T6SS immunity protein Tdi1 C-terminal domain-containing protein n=1 Tax=Isoptericola variabilis (strain 225) TaxID=743718 RepID=F6FSZ6_ISOV2|nr:T6SS immunity protein Tdi1 domain-containing protein [Isoptericola variabilis]AEG43137.1 Domain of unknown function DUF1851 [Isoptericola variabilis 225]TWH35068.1 hypothetical protein L600_000100000720 [Isoptericola variabilis J7]
MDLLRTFDRDAFEYGLAAWSWLGVRGRTPRFATAFGDVFLESLEGWWFLDTVEGSLRLRWSTAVEMYAELESPDGRAEILLQDVVDDAARRGATLRPDEVFAFTPHPAVGGRLSADCVEPVRFELALRLAGRLHEQLRVPASPLLLGHVTAPAASPGDVWSR